MANRREKVLDLSATVRWLEAQFAGRKRADPPGPDPDPLEPETQSVFAFRAFARGMNRRERRRFFDALRGSSQPRKRRAP